ncbi:MAG: hypothetical protein R3338_10410 [Thermoanaerobaculia bacterium]|nr:hypothetical protein [Thermoanaerobaculia bacterium]
MTDFCELRDEPVRETIVVLSRRIEERFPASGLAEVGRALIELADENARVIEDLRRPLWWLRALTIVAIGGLVALVGYAILTLATMQTGSLPRFTELVQTVDAAVNELIFLSIAIFFLVSLERRFKRNRALAMIHKLRGIAHVVDMHQLTKDPEHVLGKMEATASSPKRVLTRFQLTRYLDYCSEMLSLISKLAALQMQSMQDPIVLEAVTDVETLTNGLSRKVWQKITILDTVREEG